MRGAYGEFTESRGYGASGLLNDGGPFSLLETYRNSVTNSTVALTFPKPFPTTATSSLLPTPSVTALPADGQEGVIRQFNATVEHQVRGLGIRASYIGARGSGMNYTLDINKPAASTVPFTTTRLPYPQFDSTYVTRNDGSWRYNALQAEVRRRAGAVTFDSHFTWSKNTSNYANTYDPYHVTEQWTRDAAGRSRYAVTSATWTAPRGFMLQGIATFASGGYYSALFTGPDPANASPGYVTQLADCVGDPDAGARTRSQWFNPAAFAIPAATAGRYGTCGMNSLEGFPIRIAHVSVSKTVPLGESVRAVFSARVSNATNSPHFTTPNNNLSNPGAGQFTAASVAGSGTPEQLGARQIDLRLRIQW